MKRNKATAYNYHNSMLTQIREDATGYKRMTLYIGNLQSGDVIVSSGEVVRQIFDHIFDPRKIEPFIFSDGEAISILVQFTQVSGLSVVSAETSPEPSGRKEFIEVFRPVEEES